MRRYFLMSGRGSINYGLVYALNALFFTTLVAGIVRPWWYDWLYWGWGALTAYCIYLTLRPHPVDTFLNEHEAGRQRESSRRSHPNSEDRATDQFTGVAEIRASEHRDIQRNEPGEATAAPADSLEDGGRETWYPSRRD